MNTFHTPTSRAWIVPTRELAMLIYRAFMAGKLPFNYCVGAKDVNGYYVYLSNADWVQPGKRHFNPHWRT